MVKQTRIIFEVGDIVGVRLRCKACSEDTLQSIKREARVVDQCPHCGEPWRPPSQPLFVAQELARTLKLLRDEDPRAKVSAILEIDGDEATA